jgi:SAM-dependent methyltransferase
VNPAAYAQHAEVEAHHWWFVARRRILARVIESLALPGDAHLLEVGAGTGGNLALLARHGSVTAVEPDEGARSLSSSLHPEARHARSLEEVDARFDATFLLDVIEHLDEPMTLLKSVRALLAPGAPLVVTVPAHAWLFGKHDRFLHHRRRYSRTLLRAQLDAAGFEVRMLSAMNSTLLPLAVGARLLEKMTDFVRGPVDEARGMTVPPKHINRLLTEVFAVESRLLPEHGLPFGLSLLAIAQPGAQLEREARRTDSTMRGTFTNTSR